MISLIVAIDKNRAIGRNNQLLCKLKDDIKNFVNITTGQTVVMGRKTFDSIGAKPLKNRQNIVLSREIPMRKSEDDVLFVDNIAHILMISQLRPSKEFIIIGGEEIYKQFLPYASRIYLTEIEATFPDADAFFPEFDKNLWEVKDEDSLKSFYQMSNEENEYAFDFNILTKKLGELL